MKKPSYCMYCKVAEENMPGADPRCDACEGEKAEVPEVYPQGAVSRAFDRWVHLCEVRELLKGFLDAVAMTYGEVVDAGKEPEAELTEFVQSFHRAFEDAEKREQDAWRKVLLLSAPRKEGEDAGRASEADIQKARDYPIDAVVEVNARNYAKCVWHEDNNPSMWVRGNWAHCFSCGKSGDVISVYRAQTGASFNEAVKHLSRWEVVKIGLCNKFA